MGLKSLRKRRAAMKYTSNTFKVTVDLQVWPEQNGWGVLKKCWNVLLSTKRPACAIWICLLFMSVQRHANDGTPAYYPMWCAKCITSSSQTMKGWHHVFDLKVEFSQNTVGKCRNIIYIIYKHALVRVPLFKCQFAQISHPQDAEVKKKNRSRFTTWCFGLPVAAKWWGMSCLKQMRRGRHISWMGKHERLTGWIWATTGHQLEVSCTDGSVSMAWRVVIVWVTIIHPCKPNRRTWTHQPICGLAVRCWTTLTLWTNGQWTSFSSPPSWLV